MKSMKLGVVGALLAGAAFALPATSAQASCTFELDFEFSGADEPEGGTPWLTATFENIGVDTVRLTMSASGLVEEESVDEWSFNLDPTLDPTSLSIVHDSGEVADSVSTGADAFKADGDGSFDILFDFPNSGDRFTSGETSVYILSGIVGLSETSFDFPSVDNQGDPTTIFTAAHIQSIDTTDNDNSGSGWIGGGECRRGPPPIPVPPAVWGGLALLSGLGIHKTVRQWRLA